MYAYPPGVTELALIGHSMGGLVAHHAPCWAAGGCAVDPGTAPRRLHRDTPLRRTGRPRRGLARVRTLGGGHGRHQVGAAVLNTRSAGIKDLRHGLADSAHAPLPGVRFASGRHYAEAAPAALSRVARRSGRCRWPAPSVIAVPLSRPSAVWTRTLTGVDHFHLANHPQLPCRGPRVARIFIAQRPSRTPMMLRKLSHATVLFPSPSAPLLAAR
ncbi:MAG: hypothetical protein R2838_13950 [Caldilineaceae bacterium]